MRPVEGGLQSSRHLEESEPHQGSVPRASQILDASSASIYATCFYRRRDQTLPRFRRRGLDLCPQLQGDPHRDDRRGPLQGLPLPGLRNQGDQGLPFSPGRVVWLHPDRADDVAPHRLQVAEEMVDPFPVQRQKGYCQAGEYRVSPCLETMQKDYSRAEGFPVWKFWVQEVLEVRRVAQPRVGAEG